MTLANSFSGVSGTETRFCSMWHTEYEGEYGRSEFRLGFFRSPTMKTKGKRVGEKKRENVYKIKNQSSADLSKLHMRRCGYGHRTQRLLAH